MHLKEPLIISFDSDEAYVALIQALPCHFAKLLDDEVPLYPAKDQLNSRGIRKHAGAQTTAHFARDKPCTPRERTAHFPAIGAEDISPPVNANSSCCRFDRSAAGCSKVTDQDQQVQFSRFAFPLMHTFKCYF